MPSPDGARRAGAATGGNVAPQTIRSASAGDPSGLFRARSCLPFGFRFGTKQRKENDVADGVRIGEQHGKPVYADALTGSRRQAMTKRAEVVHVEFFRNILAALRHLLKKPPLLFGRIVELGETIGDFHPGGEDLETLGERRIVRLLFRER